MKRVLIITDFSDNARKALDYGRILFERMPVTFYLLHVYDYHLNNEYESEWIDIWAEEAMNELRGLLREIKKDNQNTRHSFDISVKPAPLINAIWDVTDKIGIEAIITTSKGPKGAMETFLGIDTVSILKKVNTLPILVVPASTVLEKPSQILFSTNFKRTFNRKELHMLILVAKSCSCRIKIVQIMADKNLDEFQKANKDYLTLLFKGLDHSFEKINVKTSETDAINHFVSDVKADMVSLVNHRYNFLQRLTKENVVKKATFNSKVPLLVLPELVKPK